MIYIEKYSVDKKKDWDEFIHHSKNGFFMFKRNYMDYHSDRFQDFSLMVYDDDDLIAVLPASIHDNALVSHGGLTFGGFITDSKINVNKMFDVFDEVRNYIRLKFISKLIYKCIPCIYHSFPSQEDLYVLFRRGAKLFRRDVTSSVYLPERLGFQKIRLRCIKRAISSSLKVMETEDFKSFWPILESNLADRHNARPVHSIEEIERLHSKFPNNIKLFASYKDDTMLGGVVIYESKNVAHAQYIANSPEGKMIGSLDIIFSYLIESRYKLKKYFDFGISTEEKGCILNKELIFFKEGFGARAIVHDFYEIDI